MASLERLNLSWSKYIILLSLVIVYIAISTAIVLNPWFSWRENALSDLGGPQSHTPMIFNLGLIIGGILGFCYPLYLLKFFKSVITRFGTLLFSLAMVFLILIGAFPEGTRLHYPVSVSFFATIFIAMLIMSFGLLIEGKTKEGFFGIILSVSSYFIAVGNNFMSIALREIIGAIALTIWLVYWDYKTFEA